MTRIKICGLKQAEHVKVAVDAGADAIGFVFAESSRKVTPKQARELARLIPSSVKKVGVFVDSLPEDINRIARDVPLDYVQLHGDEPDEILESIDVPVIRAYSIRSSEDAANAFASPAPLILVDAPGTAYRGGSGHTFNWKELEHYRLTRPFILAGGLNPGNVAAAIQQVRPVMVDVSSGVETAGTKDPEKITAFIRAVREATR
ncbi:phosphoribosylanthranilate isomerase [Chryseomicrobium palamuruense]|uniref:N-(5'-phosphoribosyl)anthranilate isomerase n=1 Tax=Chryseomicrobium palamuruense TaxID=682973 RepID=A0ABV8UUK5_9BACL